MEILFSVKQNNLDEFNQERSTLLHPTLEILCYKKNRTGIQSDSRAHTPTLYPNK